MSRKEPSTQEKMRDVIARLQDAARGNMMLDALILRAITPGAKQYRPQSSAARKLWITQVDGYIPHQPDYTRTVDDALRLVYEDGGGLLLHLSDIGADGLPYAEVSRHPSADDKHAGWGATLPLAICHAAMKARLAELMAPPPEPETAAPAAEFDL